MLRAGCCTAPFLAALALLLSLLEVRADSRVALVIGNAAYQNTAALANPENDAEDTAAALRRVGFNVHFERNLTKRGMERALAAFARVARDADAALFYYAGHGMQYHGLNYLMPIDAKLEDEFSLNFEMTRLDDVMTSLGRSRSIRILILDACRRNPLVERLAGMATTRDFVPARGLARIDAARGMVIAYSTQPDQFAEDGTGLRNSPFTASLVKQIDEPGLEIGTMFRRVATEVNRTTGGRQFPELSISLLGEFFFNPADTDTQAWSKVRGSRDPGQLRNFLQRYPASPLATDARERLETLEHATQERLAREKAVQERAERERIAQEEAATARLEKSKAEEEQKQLAREQAAPAASTSAPNQTQAGMQTAPPEPSPTPPPSSAVETLTPEIEENRQQPPQSPAAPASSAQTQTADLTNPPTVSATAAVPSPPSGGSLIQEIKKELTRVGCYPGELDDKWPTAQARASVQKFAKLARMTMESPEPTTELLDIIRGKSGRVCPIECGPRQIERDGRCVAKTCPAGSDLNDDGDCTPRRRAVSRPEPEDKNDRPRAHSPESKRAARADSQWDPYDRSRIVTPGGRVTCGRNGCKTVPVGCRAVRFHRGGGMGGKVICP
jgi:Caspase domain